jgi:hypothetical protein
MSTTATPSHPEPTARSGGTRIMFDLKKHLTASELERFREAADAAGAPNLTEHFLNLTLRIPHGTPTEGRTA